MARIRRRGSHAAAQRAQLRGPRAGGPRPAESSGADMPAEGANARSVPSAISSAGAAAAGPPAAAMPPARQAGWHPAGRPAPTPQAAAFRPAAAPSDEADLPATTAPAGGSPAGSSGMPPPGDAIPAALSPSAWPAPPPAASAAAGQPSSSLPPSGSRPPSGPVPSAGAVPPSASVFAPPAAGPPESLPPPPSGPAAAPTARPVAPRLPAFPRRPAFPPGGLRASLTPKRTVALIGAIATLAVLLVSAGSPDPSAEPAVQQFLLAWEQGQYRTAASLTTGEPTAVTAALRTAYRQLDAANLVLSMGRITQHGDNGAAQFNASIDLGRSGAPWEYQGRLALRMVDSTWEIVWSPSVIYPGLRPGFRLAVVTRMPRRAALLDDTGSPLARRSLVYIAGVHPGRLNDPRRTAD